MKKQTTTHESKKVTALKLLFTVLVTASCGLATAQQAAPAASEVAQPTSTYKSFNGPSGLRTWSIGVHAGALAAIAPIGGSNDFTKWKPQLGYGLYIKKQISHIFGIQAEFLRGKLSGDNTKKLGNGEMPNRAYASFTTELNWSAGLERYH